MHTQIIKALKEQLSTFNVDAILISSPVNIHYLTGYSNFSRDEREAYLFVTKKSATLFTDARYVEAVEKIIPSIIHATVERPAAKIINQTVKSEKITKIGFEKNLTFAEYKRLKKNISTKLILTDNIIENLRSIKEKSEIVSIKKAAKLTNDVFEYILPLIKTGVTEKQIALEMEMYIKKNGGTLAFETIVAFGTNSSVPHHMTSDKKLSNKDEFILLDFGAKVDGYCADMTRTLLTKNASAKARKIYDTVLEAQRAAENYINSVKNISGKKAYETADEIITSAGYESIPHGLGHGIGLEVHEEPHLSKFTDFKLSAANYFSIEPGIYIPGFGGVRIEDDYLLTEKGLKQITNSNKNLIVI